MFIWSSIKNLIFFLLPVAGCDAATDQSSIRVIEMHESRGFSSAVDDRHSDVPSFNQVESSEHTVWVSLSNVAVVRKGQT